MALSLDTIKSQFPIFTHRPELVYLDSAATSQKPKLVIQAMTDFYEKGNANVHRGLYELSSRATQSYEASRRKAAEFIGANDPKSIAFTKGATESINIIAHSFLKKNMRQGDNVVISGMEHHANLIPWQQIYLESKSTLKVIPVDEKGELILEKLDGMLDDRTKLVALTHISNVLGTINPVEKIISIAHQKNIPVLVDGAQSVGHIPVDVEELGADFLVFSAHKMFGPLGVGVLYAREKFASEIDPYNFGGGSIRNVEFGRTEFLDYPYNLEAGTGNISGVIGLGAAIDFVRGLDLSEASAWVKNLAVYFKERLKGLGGISIVGEPKEFAGIISFNVDSIHPHDVASFLANENIAVRAGHHCAQPLLKSMNLAATVRASFSIYNTRDDVDKIANALIALKKFWK